MIHGEPYKDWVVALSNFSFCQTRIFFTFSLKFVFNLSLFSKVFCSQILSIHSFVFEWLLTTVASPNDSTCWRASFRNSARYLLGCLQVHTLVKRENWESVPFPYKWLTGISWTIISFLFSNIFGSHRQVTTFRLIRQCFRGLCCTSFPTKV